MSSIGAFGKPIPLRHIKPWEDRGGIKSLSGLRRALHSEIDAYQRQLEEIDRREAVLALKLQTFFDDLDGYLDAQEDRIRFYQGRLLAVLEELNEWKGRSDRVALKRRRQLQRERGAYKGLISQHQARAEAPEENRRAWNDWFDQSVEALDDLRKPRFERLGQLCETLASVNAAIAIRGSVSPIFRGDEKGATSAGDSSGRGY